MKSVSFILFSLISAAAVVAGLWLWQQAPDLVLDWNCSRAEVALWAVRSTVVTAIAGAQLILLTLVIGRIYRRGTFDSALTLAAAATVALAAVGAIACGFAGH